VVVVDSNEPVIREEFEDDRPVIVPDGDSEVDCWIREQDGISTTLCAQETFENDTWTFSDSVPQSFGVIWKRTYNITEAGLYTFSFSTNFGTRYIITDPDGNVIASEFGVSEKSIEIELTTGQNRFLIFGLASRSPQLNLETELRFLGNLADSLLFQAAVFVPDLFNVIERTVEQNSPAELRPQVIGVFNRAENMELVISWDLPQGVFMRLPVEDGAHTINTINIAPREEEKFVLDFEESALTQLEAGTYEGNVEIRLSAGEINLRPDDEGVVIGPPPDDMLTEPIMDEQPIIVEPEEPPAPPTGSDEEIIVPPPPPPEPVLSVAFTETEPLVSDTEKFAAGQFSLRIDNDDPTKYTYLWDFDVNDVSLVRGSVTAINPSAAWQMTSADLAEIEAGGAATREVSVTATKGSTVLQETLVIQLDDPRLLDVEDPIEPPPPPPPDDGGSDPIGFKDLGDKQIL